LQDYATDRRGKGTVDAQIVTYYVMPVRTTVDIPEPLHEELRRRAESTGTSIRSLIVKAVESAYSGPPKRKRLTGPLIRGKGKRGPLYPVGENPYDLIFP
jgi:hypothetical protein